MDYKAAKILSALGCATLGTILIDTTSMVAFPVFLLVGSLIYLIVSYLDGKI